MEQAFYFMPDISGFTKFVNNTEIEHSIHIISELLELLIDTNSIDLKLAEVEGDALFMFTTKSLQFEEIFDQVHKMMIAFHTHTKMYEHQRICNCGSCRATTNLELKFIIHYGDLNFIKVKDTIKPYGKDVIQTHRLLKNNVPLQEYLLISSSVYDLFKNQIDSSWKNLVQVYDQQQVNYYYTNLSHIKNDVDVEEEEHSENQIKAIPKQSIQKVINANIEITYSLISELKYRHLWDEDIKRIDFDENKINRIGTQHNCVLQFGNLNFETISGKSDESLVYGEKTKDMMFAKDFQYILRLDKINDTKTNLNLELYLEFTGIGDIIKNNILKKLTKLWEKKLEQLNQLAIKQSIIN